MKFLKPICIMLLSVLYGIDTYAQGVDPNSLVQVPKAAQPWSFATYGSKEQNLNHGTVSTSIPIYTYQDEDFTIPVSLDYSSNGYKPNQQANSVGLGWSLKAGGYITRKVVGVRDDRPPVYRGFWDFWDKGYHREYPGSIFMEGGIPTQQYYYNGYVFYLSDSSIETETTSDQYTFNFGNHFGQFSLDGGKVIHVYNANHPEGEYKVDVSEMLGHGGSPFDNQGFSKLTITTGDGYVYTFERGEGTGQYGIMDWLMGKSYYAPYGTARTYWPLTSIQAPNGRSVLFDYGDEGVENYEANGSIQWFSDYVDLDVYREKTLADCLYIREWTQQLQRIIIQNGPTIEFDYTDRRQEKGKLQSKYNPWDWGPDTLQTLDKLSSIKVSRPLAGGGREYIKECYLAYVYAADNNPVMLLNNLYINGEGAYSFEYYDADWFPEHGVLNLDHWGYSNSANYDQPTYWGDSGGYDGNTAYITPTVTVNSLNQETITQSHREPNPEGAIRGMLKKITYPTKGSTTFEYEPHTYRRRVTRDLTNENMPYLQQLSTEKYAGGMRISKITDNPGGDRLATTRTFRYNYVNDQGDITTNSGILLHSPRYTNQSQTFQSYYNLTKYPEDRYHIEYAEVMEEFTDGSFNVYHFSSYADTPDRPYDKEFVEDIHGHSTTLSVEEQFYVEPYSRYLERGKLMSTRKFDTNKKLTYREEDIWGIPVEWYYTFVQMDIFMVKLASWKAYLYRERARTKKIIRKEITEWLDNGQNITSYAFGYNHYGQLKEEISYRNGIKIGTKKWQWIYDVSPDNPHNHNDINVVHARMLDLNLRGTILREDVLDADDRVIGSRKYNYGLYPKKGVLQFGDPHLQEIMDMVSAPTPPASVDEVSYSTTDRYDYDSRGHVTERIDKDGVPTCYIWDGNDIVVVGVNCTWAEAHAKITSKYPFFALLPSSEPTPQALWQLLQDIPNAQFTVFSHKPYVGILSITNPRGETTYYDYTETGKLESVSKLDRTTVDPNDKSQISSYEYSAE